MHNPIEQFREAMQSAGLIPPDMIEPDGKLHRFASNGKRGDDAGYYVLHGDGIPAGTFGDWRSGIIQSWRADIGRRLTPAEDAEHRAKIEAMRQQRDAETLRGRTEAATKAAAIWKAATPANPDNPYLVRKQISPVATLREIDAGAVAAVLGYTPKYKGEPLSGRLLVAPVKVGDSISTCELIDGDGRKSAIYGGTKSAGYWAAQSLSENDGPEPLQIGEGVATVLSGRESNGYLSIAALSSGNLLAVAKVMRERYPTKPIIILADLLKDTGLPDPHAIEAARLVDGGVAVPDFGTDRQSGQKDMNDMASIHGLKAVKRAIDAAGAPAMAGHQSSGNNALAGDLWPDPLPIPDALPAVRAFDYSLLPDSLRPWIEDIAERVQCPPDFPAVGAMISLSAVVGRKIGIRPKRRDDWLEVPNLWGAIVGRPGVMKSPALRESMRPLRKLEALAAELFETDTRGWRREQEMAKIRREAARSRAVSELKKGNDVSPDVLGDDFDDDEPQARRYVVNDCSVEALGEILLHNPNGTLAYRDELIGLLKSLDKEGQEGARGFYLSAWSGTDGYTFDRIGRGLNMRIDSCCLSLLGSIQPAIIGQYLRQAVAGAGGDGLISRFQLLVWPDIAGDWRDVDRWPDTDAKARAYDTFERLDTLEPAKAGAIIEDGNIPYLRFDDAAQELFSEWRGEFEQRIRSGNDHAAFESHLAKYRKLVPALSLLIHLADNQGAGAIGETALLQALAWAEYLEAHASRCYASVTQAEAESARALLTRIRRNEVPAPFTPRDVYLKHWAYLGTPEATHEAVRLLCDLDYLAKDEIITPGRKRTEYRINPKVRQP